MPTGRRGPSSGHRGHIGPSGPYWGRRPQGNFSLASIVIVIYLKQKQDDFQTLIQRNIDNLSNFSRLKKNLTNENGKELIESLDVLIETSMKQIKTFEILEKLVRKYHGAALQKLWILPEKVSCTIGRVAIRIWYRFAIKKSLSSILRHLEEKKIRDEI